MAFLSLLSLVSTIILVSTPAYRRSYRSHVAFEGHSLHFQSNVTILENSENAALQNATMQQLDRHAKDAVREKLDSVILQQELEAATLQQVHDHQESLFAAVSQLSVSNGTGVSRMTSKVAHHLDSKEATQKKLGKGMLRDPQDLPQAAGSQLNVSNIDVDGFWILHFQEFVGMYQCYFNGARFPVPATQAIATPEGVVTWPGSPYSGVAGLKLGKDSQFRIEKQWASLRPMQAILERAIVEKRLPVTYTEKEYIDYIQNLFDIDKQAWELASRNTKNSFLPLPPLPNVYEDIRLKQPDIMDIMWPDVHTDQWSSFVNKHDDLKLWRSVYLNGPHPWAADRDGDRTLPLQQLAKTDLVEKGKDTYGFAYVPSFPIATRIGLARMLSIHRGGNGSDVDWFKDPGDEVVPAAFTDVMYSNRVHLAKKVHSPDYHKQRSQNIVGSIVDGDLPALVGLCEVFNDKLLTALLKDKGLDLVHVTPAVKGDTIAMYYDGRRLTLMSIFTYRTVDDKALLGAVFELKSSAGLLVGVMIHNRQDSARFMIEAKFAELRAKIDEHMKQHHNVTSPAKFEVIVMGDMNVYIEEVEGLGDKLQVALLDPYKAAKIQPVDDTYRAMTYRTDFKSRKEIDYMYTSLPIRQWSSRYNKKWESIDINYSDHAMLKNMLGVTGDEFAVVSWNLMDPKTLDVFDPKQIEPTIVQDVLNSMDPVTKTAMEKSHPDFTHLMNLIASLC